MTPTRESVFSALFALVWSDTTGSQLTWGDPPRGFLYGSRRVRLATEQKVQPSFMQAEHNEVIDQVTNMPYRQIWRATWLAYQSVGMDKSATPSIENNLITDALMSALLPPPWMPQQTLSGLVHKVTVKGQILKISGDMEGQGLVAIPVTVLVP